MSNNTVIHCIGDSHVDFLSGYNNIQPEWPLLHHDRVPLFKTYRLGAVLAYTISKKGSHGHEALHSLLTTIPPKSYVMLMLGEIDCRVHLIKQAKSQKKPVSVVVKKCVDNYFSSIEEIKNAGYQIIVWGVIPSTRFEVQDDSYPTVGTCRERNEVTKLFNLHLEAKAKSKNLPFLSLYNDLVDADGLTNMKYFIDLIHLSTRAIPLVIKKMSTIVPLSRNVQSESMKVYWANYIRYYITRRLLNFLVIHLRVYPVAQRLSQSLKK